MFTEKDWEGIITIYNSVKEKEPLKVGRFGLGFKSVFHMTNDAFPIFFCEHSIIIHTYCRCLKLTQNQ
jgi:sacsin